MGDRPIAEASLLVALACAILCSDITTSAEADRTASKTVTQTAEALLDDLSAIVNADDSSGATRVGGSCSEARYCTKSSFMLHKKFLCKTGSSFRSKCPKTCGLCPAAAGDAATAATSGQKPPVCKCLPKQGSDPEYCGTKKYCGL